MEASAAFANLTLGELDEEEPVQQLSGIPLHQQHDEEEQEIAFLAVGRLVTRKQIRFHFFKDTMASIWQPVMGMNVMELQPRLYLFRFFHEKDIARIIDDGPWTYEQSLLILRRLEPHEDPEAVVLSHAEFWIQIHGLPVGFRSEAVLQAIGRFAGELVKTDENNFDGSLRAFYRFRVALDISKPLKKGMRLKKDDGEWFTITFRYERLPTFCFLCGVIGHGEKVCAKMLESSEQHKEKPFGPSLRAESRRNAPNSGEQWLAPDTYADRRLWRTSGKETVSDNSVQNIGFGSPRNDNIPNSSNHAIQEMSPPPHAQEVEMPDAIPTATPRQDVTNTQGTLHDKATILADNDEMTEVDMADKLWVELDNPKALNQKRKCDDGPENSVFFGPNPTEDSPMDFGPKNFQEAGSASPAARLDK